MTTATAIATQGVNASALMPATDRTRKISCGAYATELIASEANTGRAIRLGSSV